jgi:hypothetical protein
MEYEQIALPDLVPDLRISTPQQMIDTYLAQN